MCRAAVNWYDPTMRYKGIMTLGCHSETTLLSVLTGKAHEGRRTYLEDLSLVREKGNKIEKR